MLASSWDSVCTEIFLLRLIFRLFLLTWIRSLLFFRDGFWVGANSCVELFKCSFLTSRVLAADRSEYTLTETLERLLSLDPNAEIESLDKSLFLAGTNLS